MVAIHFSGQTIHFLPPSGSLKAQLASNFATADTFAGIQWFKNIYSFTKPESPVTNLECFYQCFKVQTLTCQLFVLLNDTCYFGRADISNGTSTGISLNTPVTVYSRKGEGFDSAFIIIFPQIPMHLLLHPLQQTNDN